MLTSPQSPWSKLQEYALSTWAREARENWGENTFTYTGTPLDTVFEKSINRMRASRIGSFLWRESHLVPKKGRFTGVNSIHVEIPEGWDTMLPKLYGSLLLIDDVVKYDFIVKVNTTTFVNLENLHAALSKQSHYLGAVSKNKLFAAGWATILSKEAVSNLLENPKIFFAHGKKYEDEALGASLAELGFAVEPIQTGIYKEIQADLSQVKNFPMIRAKSTHNRIIEEGLMFREMARVLNYG